MHTHTCTRARTHMHIHMRTHMHIHTQPIRPSFPPSPLTPLPSTDQRLQIDDETEAEDVKAQEESVLHDLRSAINTTKMQKLIKDRLMDYLTFNSYHLPMYARAGSW